MSNERSPELPSVILRGFEEKPTLAYAVKMQPNGRYVNVSGSFPVRSTIGWPITDAFDYSEENWRLVDRLFREGTLGDLRAQWHAMGLLPKTFIDSL